MKTSEIKHITKEELNPRDAFAVDVLEGLTAPQKSLSSRYFYDDRGSELFQEITGLPEYYPTRAEYEILENNRGRLSEIISEAAGDLPLNLIELGSGDGHKSILVLDRLMQDQLNFRYVPIDISEGAMSTLMNNLAESHGDLSTLGLVSDYFQGLNWINENKSHRNMALFLGSNIGNFSPQAASSFLLRLWNSLNDGDLVLIGFDLKKDPSILVRAYNDSAGVTREFNLNLLRRINRELGGNFDLDFFQHYAPYNPVLGAMESYIISTQEHEVFIEHLNRNIHFREFEAVHTEYSYKYSQEDILELARHNGFEIVSTLMDSQNLFADSIWRVRK